MTMNISNISDISSTDNSEVGGMAYFMIYISDYLPYVIVVSFGAVMGFLGTAF